MLIEAVFARRRLLYAATNLDYCTTCTPASRPRAVQRDVEYIVQEGQVVLIDEHTGRTMPGRRLSEGLHQAIEAKRGSRSRVRANLASTTFQNFFRIYDKLPV